MQRGALDIRNERLGGGGGSGGQLEVTDEGPHRGLQDSWERERDVSLT